jgi:CelD/BcsL family acetyltransferase involved in cellulose biosynthesis
VTVSLHWSFQPVAAVGDFESVWDEFNDRTFRFPLLSAAFLRIGLRHFGSGDEQLAIATDSRGTAAMCLMRVRSAAVMETFQPSQFPVGPWLQRSDVDLAHLARSLVHERSGQIALASLTQLDPLFVPRPADGPLLKSMRYISTGTIELPDMLADYMAGRSENLLANLRRRQHKIEREHGPVSLEVLERPADVAKGIDCYADLEGVGWKARVGTALVKGNVQWRFYTEALEFFCGKGQSRAYVLRIGDEPAAATLVVIAGKTAYMLKTTHNERLRSVAPGMSLRRHFIESLYEREASVRRVEIYGALNESQRPWVTGVRDLYHSNVYRGPVIAALHTLSRRIKSSVPRHRAVER